MIALAEIIYEQAFDLPAKDRIDLIGKLLYSTNIPTHLTYYSFFPNQ